MAKLSVLETDYQENKLAPTAVTLILIEGRKNPLYFADTVTCIFDNRVTAGGITGGITGGRAAAGWVTLTKLRVEAALTIMFESTNARSTQMSLLGNWSNEEEIEPAATCPIEDEDPRFCASSRGVFAQIRPASALKKPLL